MRCPPATQDHLLNVRNRDLAIRQFDYGPANPALPSIPYWTRLAGRWGISVEEAQTMRCGNCAFFDVSPGILACIGFPATEMGGKIGYCHAHKFKCASARVCATWAYGGPVK